MGRGAQRESRIQQDIRLAIGAMEGMVAWRNNVGVLTDRQGNRIRYGLCNGSSDLISIVTMPERVVVPRGTGRFMALEVKGPDGETTEEQERFFRLVRRLGGFACEVRSVEDAAAAVVRCRAGCFE